MLSGLLVLLVIVAIVFLFIKAIISAPLLVIAIIVAYFVFRNRDSKL